MGHGPGSGLAVAHVSAIRLMAGDQILRVLTIKDDDGSITCADFEPADGFKSTNHLSNEQDARLQEGGLD
jgi:hypothetical protein